MIIAIDNLECLPKLEGHEVIYVFKDEKLKDLLNTGLHCIRYDKIERVHINLTDYDIPCKKRAKITDKDLLEMPKVKQNKYSIIIPNYNNGKWLDKCITSVLDQTYKNFELIIVDDMSTDNSIQVINSFKDDRIRLIQNTRKRYNGGSRNVGIDSISKDTNYICFIDSDDWWKDKYVLEEINEEIDDSELMLIGLECINEKGVFITKIHEYNDYKDFFLSDNKVWCTAWARVIRKDKIVYFCEDTLMEDRVWSYRQADNVDFNKVKNFKRTCYVWNRTNKENSVSLTRNYYWNASAYCHIGHQLQLLGQLKHKEMVPILEKRINICKGKINTGQYLQY